jgi:hypothetical protein
MPRIDSSWGRRPLLYFRSNRSTPSRLTVEAILRATVSGDPT